MSLGFWTDKRFELFDPSNELNQYVLEDTGYITEILDSVMRTRAVVFQLLPIGTVLSILVQNTSKVLTFIVTILTFSNIYPHSMVYFVRNI